MAAMTTAPGPARAGRHWPGRKAKGHTFLEISEETFLGVLASKIVLVSTVPDIRARCMEYPFTV